jgi:hypothetical protein
MIMATLNVGGSVGQKVVGIGKETEKDLKAHTAIKAYPIIRLLE